jgi:hypothetical protein
MFMIEKITTSGRLAEQIETAEPYANAYDRFVDYTYDSDSSAVRLFQLWATDENGECLYDLVAPWSRV